MYVTFSCNLDQYFFHISLSGRNSSCVKFIINRKCGPRLSPEAAEKLKNRYVLMRTGATEHERETGKRITIPITVRLISLLLIFVNV